MYFKVPFDIDARCDELRSATTLPENWNIVPDLVTNNLMVTNGSHEFYVSKECLLDWPLDKVASGVIARIDSMPLPRTTSVPVVPIARLGWFFCKQCGAEEKICDGCAPDYKPTICNSCWPAVKAEMDESRRDLMEKLAGSMSIFEQEYEQRKIEAHEGKRGWDHVEALRLSLEKVRAVVVRNSNP